MKFIHIADVHLDIPFKTLSDRADLGEKRRLEQRKAFKKMVDFAKEKQVDCIFIAGDLYEHEYIKKSTIDYINTLFKEIPEIKIFITPGNHDPNIKNSYYNTYKFSSNVKIFTSKFEKVETEKYNVYGYGFDDFEMANKLKSFENIEMTNKLQTIDNFDGANKLQDFENFETPNKLQKKGTSANLSQLDKNKINIFISHGDIYNETKYNYMPIKILENAGFDYIALGHIHKRDKYYAGSLISLGFDETGKHGFIYGEIKEKNTESEKINESLNTNNNIKDNDGYLKEKNYTQGNATLQFIKADERELVYQDLDISNIQSEEELIEKINEIETGNNLYEINFVGNRKFEISINMKMLQNNIIKIKDSTKVESTSNLNENDKTLSGFFAKNLREKLKKGEISQDEYEEIMELGKEVLNKCK